MKVKLRHGDLNGLHLFPRELVDEAVASVCEVRQDLCQERYLQADNSKRNYNKQPEKSRQTSTRRMRVEKARMIF